MFSNKCLALRILKLDIINVFSQMKVLGMETFLMILTLHLCLIGNFICLICGIFSY